METLGWHSLGTAFDCRCGIRHALPIEACYVGLGAAHRLAAFTKDRCGKKALIISDENTHAVGSEPLLSTLSAVNKAITEEIFPGAPALDATRELADDVAEAGKDADFYVAIGGGTLCDLAKAAGHDQKKPVLLYPTAASMNGYTSAIVALKVRGLKATLPCKPATGIFADPAVAATAPQRMTAAGVADFLSKAPASADWRLAHLLRDEYFCDRPREFSVTIQPQILDAADQIGQAAPAAIALVLEALMLSGFGMVLAGSSAPASGGEHLISHYLDMKSALNGTPHDLHGTQVGLGTLHCLRLWEKVITLEPDQIDIDACLDAQPSEKQISAWIHQDWGEQLDAEVQAQWDMKKLSKDNLRQELMRFKDQLPTIRDQVRLELLPAEVVEQAIAAAGGPVQPEAMDAPLDEYQNAVQRARFIRNRFNILDLAAELGLS